MERYYLSENDAVLHEENNLVVLRLANGKEYPHIEPRRLFPVTYPHNYITFLDEEGTEIAVARSMSDLTAESQKIVSAGLSEYYLVPTIKRIVSTEEKYGKLYWTVETERGERSFDIRNRNHDIRTLPDGRIRVRDSNDNRYIIEGIDSLDPKSRALLIADL